MRSILTAMARTLSVRADPRHGPLPLLLVGMTVVTGLVDAFSYLMLGHVFVANMTGNVVFLGFALAGAPGFSIAASALALFAFWTGALIGGWVAAKLKANRAHLLTLTATGEAVLFAVAALITAVAATPLSGAARYPLIAVLAIGLGGQNATARRLAVPDLTTTVLTLTITGTAADSVLAGGTGSSSGRRLVSVLSMFVGALAGALLVVHGHAPLSLVAGLCLLVSIALAACRLGRGDPAWVTP